MGLEYSRNNDSNANGLQTTPEIWKRSGPRGEAHLNLSRLRLTGTSRLPGRPASQTKRRDLPGVFLQIHCGCAGLNGSLSLALSSALVCCEGTSEKL